MKKKNFEWVFYRQHLENEIQRQKKKCYFINKRKTTGNRYNSQLMKYIDPLLTQKNKNPTSHPPS